MAGGTGTPSAYLLLFAKRIQMNKEAVTYWIIVVAALMGFFIVFHHSRLAASKTGIAAKLGGLAKPFVVVSRSLRRVTIHKFPGLPSNGHFLTALVYLAVNVALLFTHIDASVLPYITVIAARAGWLSITNIAFVVFLSLKNTPLGFLTAWSYERLNVLHQIAGYVTMSLIIVHGATYSAYFIESGNMARLRVSEEIYGMAAGFTFLTLVLAGAIVRLWYYELFYILHVSFFAISLVMVGLHQPDMSKKIIVITAVAASIWVADRVVRFVRVVLYSFNNNATIYPLPHGGTRIILKKAPLGASSGEHCFLWIPKIRALEMHPFTIAAMNPLEFVVNSYDGFTRELHEYAVQNPGATLKASVEGSYGTFPNPAEYNKIVLVAGGSGASFTVGTVLNLIKKVAQGSKPSVTFVWIVKDPARLEWFAGHLSTIRQALNASIQLYVTRAPGSQDNSQNPSSKEDRSRSGTISSEASTPFTPSSEKFEITNGVPQHPPKILTGALSDLEKSGSESDATSPNSPTIQQNKALNSLGSIPVHYGRPNVVKIIQNAINETSADQRVLIMGCGPEGLMTQVRNTTAECISTSGPAVELHCEQFGW
ncbi:ferric reductase like transmembrane component [Colletotrichum orchidophilum]|uniref:Ferric reductase like transmembrane component n=1 Tax=Colletotrichum orchidophilum TaxID=1209926 RepID=A0A1G4B1R1_9PEZI|nr:ferric reductase like transmembrane component [Colletotrichum orchidophilum]OHE95296.1 ferric reductase like transmembrane component [Colletotrichum orchidophilum]